MHLSLNLKLLRKRLDLTQEEMAQKTGISRSKLNAYENEHTEPSLDGLLHLSSFYKINVDTLLKVDLSGLSESQLNELENGYDTYIKGSKIRVLASTVNNENLENIELVPVKAKAGYVSGYNDPEFISKLPTFQLPFLSQDRKYRTFQISGDSMLPIKDKSYVVGEFVQNWNDIKDGNAYIVITSEEGVVFKIVFNQIKKNHTLLMHSLNSLYQDYEVKINDVKEVWKFVTYFSTEMPEPEVTKENLKSALDDLDRRINKLRALL